MVSPHPQQKKAVIYCRVSTKEQVEEGNSLASQERHCREYAEKHGYSIAAAFIERGESAKTVDRTELKKMMAFCSSKKNAVSVIIAYKIDRISRSTEDYSYIKIILRRHGVEIKSTSENFDSTPAGRFMENIISNVSQFDNDVRAERCSGGMRDAVKDGRYVWTAPYGYSNVRVNGKATIAPSEKAPSVKRAFEEIALNKFPPGEIRKRLIEEGMLFRNGRPISKSRFYSLLRDELYTGWINKFGERTKGHFEPIISEELFAFVQKILTGKRYMKSAYSKKNLDFPLRGLFVHASGKLLTGGWSRGRSKRYAYYLFHGTGINLKKDILEEMFSKWLTTFFKLDINFFDRLRESSRSVTNENIKHYIGTSGESKIKIESIKSKRLQLLDKNLEGVISNEFAKEQIALLDAELFQLKKQANTIMDTIDTNKLLSIVRTTLLEPGEFWKKASYETKVKLQRFYFPEGILFDKNGSRTTKICKLYKLKTVISPFNSCVVHFPNSKLNTQSWQILELPPREESDINTPELLEEIKTELSDLAAIIQPQLEEADLPFAYAA